MSLPAALLDADALTVAGLCFVVFCIVLVLGEMVIRSTSGVRRP